VFVNQNSSLFHFERRSSEVTSELVNETLRGGKLSGEDLGKFDSGATVGCVVD